MEMENAIHCPPDVFDSLRLIVSGTEDLKKPIDTNATPLVVLITNPSDGHWIAVCLDYVQKVYGVMGFLRIPKSVRIMLSRNMSNPREHLKFKDVSMKDLPSQREADCGARVAMFINWFLDSRMAGIADGGLTEWFMQRVQDQMETWRAARAKVRRARL